MKLIFQDDKNIPITNKGWALSELQHFKGDVLTSTTKEIPQNSNDARESENAQVIMKFDIKQIPTKEFPDVNNFKNILSDCLKDNKDKDMKATEGLREALRVLNNKEINILIAQDENTNGVPGPFDLDSNSPFYTLLVSESVSVKQTRTAGGSFGIGKNAPFISTPLRTVFYSTKYVKKNKESTLSMGKTILKTFSVNGITKQNKGYWSEDGKTPITDMKNIPEWLKRTKKGLTIAIPGFEKSETWKYELAIGLISHFYQAIHENKIEFQLDQGSIIINSDSILNLFNDENLIKTAEKVNLSSSFEEAKIAFQTFTSKESDEYDIEIQNLGNFRMKTLLLDERWKTVSFTRNGMKITNQLGKFGLKKFPGLNPFFSVIYPLDDTAIENMRSMENPQHNEFSTDFLDSEKKKNLMSKTLKQLEKEIRTHLKEIAGNRDIPESTKIEDLNALFAGGDLSGTKSSKEKEEGYQSEKLVLMKTKSEKKKATLSEDGGEKGNQGQRKGKKKRKKRRRFGDEGVGTSKNFPIEKFRIFSPKTNSIKIIFTSPTSGEASIKLQSLLYDGATEDLPIQSTNSGKIDSGFVKCSVDEGQKKELELQIPNDKFGIPVIFYGLVEETKKGKENLS